VDDPAPVERLTHELCCIAPKYPIIMSLALSEPCLPQNQKKVKILHCPVFGNVARLVAKNIQIEVGNGALQKEGIAPE